MNKNHSFDKDQNSYYFPRNRNGNAQTKPHYEQQNNFKSRDKRVEDVKIEIERNHLIDISDKRLFNYIMDENFKWCNVRYLEK